MNFLHQLQEKHRRLFQLEQMDAQTASNSNDHKSHYHVQSQHQHSARRHLLEISAYPLQTFYVPLSEEQIFVNALSVIKNDPALVKSPMTSVIAIATSADNTVLWYDHWEDGYDGTYLPPSSTTQIWGDRDASNGCAPQVIPCTDHRDVIRAGQSIILEQIVPLPRDRSQIIFDAGDRIQASIPITVNRGMYPASPGGLMAGAVDLYDTLSWGTFFQAPVGGNIAARIAGSGNTSVHFFQYSAMYFMAGEDNTVVSLPNGTNVVLNRGQSSYVRVNLNQNITSNKKIQVHLITGDIDSRYEMRWYSLLPSADCKFSFR